jgi:hypothetical protein
MPTESYGNFGLTAYGKRFVGDVTLILKMLAQP